QKGAEITQALSETGIEVTRSISDSSEQAARTLTDSSTAFRTTVDEGARESISALTSTNEQLRGEIGGLLSKLAESNIV
ncbi:hypothetical protein, partial [Klebsiella pneumoniae]|uniref:hypothetical protein n=1 Tax=Klebsiella pneumoniae TaxID=573 RepID=UPI0013D44BFF